MNMRTSFPWCHSTVIPVHSLIYNIITWWLLDKFDISVRADCTIWLTIWCLWYITLYFVYRPSFSNVNINIELFFFKICRWPKTAKRSILYSYCLPLSLHTSHAPPHRPAPLAQSALLWPTSLSVRTLIYCVCLTLVSTMLGKLTSCLDLLWTLFNIDFRLGPLASAVASPCLTNCTCETCPHVLNMFYKCLTYERVHV